MAAQAGEQLVGEGTLTPDALFRTFSSGNIVEAHAALDRFSNLPDKEPFLEPAKDFLWHVHSDRTRAWAASVLGKIGGQDAYGALLQFLQGKPERDLRSVRYARYEALVGLEGLAESASEEQREAESALVGELAVGIEGDDDLVVMAACLVQALHGNVESREKVRRELLGYREGHFGRPWAVLRALRQLPCTELKGDVLDILEGSHFGELRLQAIRTLAEYPADAQVLDALAAVIRSAHESDVRLRAIDTVHGFRDRASREHKEKEFEALGLAGVREALTSALIDENAEVRVRAAEELKGQGDPAKSLKNIIDRALEHRKEPKLDEYVEAIRRLDEKRRVAAEFLEKEMAGGDRARAQRAELMLVELGGRAAVERLSLRRSTIKELDQLLKRSEQIAKQTFETTIKQARLTFYFTMAVNVLIVLIGVVLMGVAIANVVNQPDRLASWILPGATGVLGIIMSLYFNNPRKNAHDDQTALMLATVAFLGFTREVNEIDASFKHAYLDKPEFGPRDVRVSVEQLQQAVSKTLGELRKNGDRDADGAGAGVVAHQNEQEA